EGRTFYHGHTYTGNPLGAAVALANLDLLENGVLVELPGKIERLRGHLERIAALPCIGEVRQQGMMAGIELVQERATKKPFPPELRMGGRVCRRAREQGVLLRPLGDVIVIMPPLAIEPPLLDRLMDVLYHSLHELASLV